MLKRTFEDLAARSVSGKSIDKDTFLRFFCNVPGMLGERLFFVFGSKRTGEIDFEEFCQGIALYCRGSLEQKIEFVFRMFNLKGDGRVGKGELETMLNSFVFAAESIVSGRENEVSVIGRAPNARAGRGTGPGSALQEGDVGYRAFNVLQIDEEDGAHSDNDGNLILPSAKPRGAFHPAQPLRRQSLPQAHSLSYSTSQPGSLFGPGHHSLQPSTPPPIAQRSALSSTTTSILPSSASKIGHPVHSSLDWASDDSSSRIQHMVDEAMRGQPALAPLTSPCLVPRAPLTAPLSVSAVQYDSGTQRLCARCHLCWPPLTCIRCCDLCSAVCAFRSPSAAKDGLRRPAPPPPSSALLTRNPPPTMTTRPPCPPPPRPPPRLS